MRKKRRSLVFPREVLLVEIERHCAEASCNARTRIGLTKEEARLFDGFECAVCERWNADGLTERDIPDWWEELTVTGLSTLRGESSGGGDAPTTHEAGGDGGEVVARLSEAWHNSQARREGRAAAVVAAAVDAPEDGGEESL
ncbi:MAG TPA: hypothetical protein VEZ40_17715 [Pyrinomonadaceae bacterium]|nr:hypothetical protein [Pyrinomonadaceae bacterium]